jgi:RNA polymerase sigma-70 factor (ECF subfamily)
MNALAPSLSSDGELIAATRAGEDLAFEELYRRYRRRIVAYAHRLVGDPGRAEDVTQEVFLRLWSDPSRFDPSRGQLGPYLRLMARSRALDVWRSERSGERALERAGRLRQRDEAPDEQRPDAAAEHDSDRDSMLAALRRLPAAQGEAIFLRYFGDLGSAEIAARSGVPVGTAKGRIRIGLEKLRAEPGLA